MVFLRSERLIPKADAKRGRFDLDLLESAGSRTETHVPERKSVAPVDPAEAAEVLSRYIAEAAKRALSGMAEGRGDVADQVALANRLIGLLPETESQGIDERAEQLMALLAEQDPALALGRTASDAVRPETSIAQSSLFTGAVHEPQMFSELKKEIASADRMKRRVKPQKNYTICGGFPKKPTAKTFRKSPSDVSG